MCQVMPRSETVLPIGSLNFMTFSEDSLMINAVESVGNCFKSKSRPCVNCKPAVTPKPSSAKYRSKDVLSLGSLPSQLCPHPLLHLSVRGELVFVIDLATPDESNSFFISV